MKSKIDLPCINGRLLIREFQASDREALLEFLHDPTQLQYMMFSLGTEKEIDDFLKFALAKVKEENRTEWHLALEEKGKPGFIGSIALMIEKDTPCSAELGYWFKRSAWGKGYATEASRFMLKLGFKTLGLHRIWGKCHVKNPASAHVMEKLGMSLEGQLREHVWLRDHYRSSLLFSMLEPEYHG
jgi:ribosomal-protein-alanine N-acetyltransferase